MRSNLIIFLAIVTVLLTACGAPQDVQTLISKAQAGDGKAAMKLVNAMGSPDRDTALEAYKGVI
ncbi:MAG: hypothetical protein JSV70_04610, partial [bacterium]